MNLYELCIVDTCRYVFVCVVSLMSWRLKMTLQTCRWWWWWWWWRLTTEVSQWARVIATAHRLSSVFLLFISRSYSLHSRFATLQWKSSALPARIMRAEVMESLRKMKPVAWCCNAEQTTVVVYWWNWRRTALILILLKLILSTMMDVMAIPSRTYSFPDTRQGNRLDPHHNVHFWHVYISWNTFNRVN